MKTHICNRCKKVFRQKCHLDYHLYKRKTQCIKVEETLNNYPFYNKKYMNSRQTTLYNEEPRCTQTAPRNTQLKSIVCEHCNMTFTRKSSLRRHLKNSCNMHANYHINNIDLIKIIDKLERRNNELEKLVNKSISNNITMNNINSNNTTNINHINNIQIIGYGKEDLSKLSDNTVKYFLERGFNSVPSLLEYVHFNEKNPENHNLYIPSISRNSIMIYDGKYWKDEDMKKTLDQIIDSNKEFLCNKIEFYKENNDIDQNTVKKFERFIDKSENDIIEMRNLKNKVKRVLYNERHVVMKTKKINEKHNKLK